MPYLITEIVSPSHKIHIKQTDTKATVELAENSRGNNSNFVLLIGLDDQEQQNDDGEKSQENITSGTARMWVEKDEKGHYATMVSTE